VIGRRVLDNLAVLYLLFKSNSGLESKTWPVFHISFIPFHIPTIMPKAKQKQPAKTGPNPDTLKIEGKWQDAVKKSLAKKEPAEGWPKG
jgi:hypothetical protein